MGKGREKEKERCQAGSPAAVHLTQRITRIKPAVDMFELDPSELK